MAILEKLGLRPIINASATLTKLGGSVMPPEVVEAMVDGARHYVDYHELQRRVGERIAELTHNEAAYVSSGAAAGLVLATAACITGTDPAKIARLPDLTGMKNEVIVHRMHRNGYDHAVRQVGVKLMEIGVGGTAPWELEAAINERTAAIFWFQGVMTGRGDLPLETVIEIANRHDVPVVVDAAAQLPPVHNLWRFTQMGAALAVFSGGKELRGPQSSGLVLGRKDLIEACRVNGSPNASIGRPMKVGKEELAGCLAAVERYVNLDHKAQALADEQTVAEWCAAWNQIPGVRAQRSFPNEAGQPLPRVLATFDHDTLHLTRDEIVDALRNGEHHIEVALSGKDGIFFNPWVLTGEERQIVQERLSEIVGERVVA
ncbi:aminotransferase class V-fold PLP-dependent enzyme [bacterium]|nr:aminotransferase class V-fold PLP-dependent enzyme [bacterium]